MMMHIGFIVARHIAYLQLLLFMLLVFRILAYIDLLLILLFFVVRNLTHSYAVCSCMNSSSQTQDVF